LVWGCGIDDRQHHIVAGTTLIGNAELVTANREHRVLVEPREDADDWIRPVVVNNDKQIADVWHKTIHQAHVERPAELYTSGYLELIEQPGVGPSEFDIQRSH
jgi:hypothetical protein